MIFVTFKVKKLMFVGCRIGAKTFTGSDSFFKDMINIWSTNSPTFAGTETLLLLASSPPHAL